MSQKCIHAVNANGTDYCGHTEHRLRKFDRDIQVTVGLLNFAGCLNKQRLDPRYSPTNLWTCHACKQYYETEEVGTCPFFATEASNEHSI